MAIFEFDVEVSTHSALRNGVVAVALLGQDGRGWHRVVVEADSLEDAALLAAQLGACVPQALLPTYSVDGAPANADTERKAIICAVFPRI